MAKAKTKTIIPEFKVGDFVTWSSQAAGSWKTKTGEVVDAPKVGEWFAKVNGYGRLATTRHRYRVKVVTKHTRGERVDFYYPSTSALSKLPS